MATRDYLVQWRVFGRDAAKLGALKSINVSGFVLDFEPADRHAVVTFRGDFDDGNDDREALTLASRLRRALQLYLLFQYGLSAHLEFCGYSKSRDDEKRDVIGEHAFRVGMIPADGRFFPPATDSSRVADACWKALPDRELERLIDCYRDGDDLYAAGSYEMAMRVWTKPLRGS